MARGGINKAVVQKARHALLARGAHPSIDAVRIELGNTGSKTTIHRYLKELEDAERGRDAASIPLSEQLANLVSQLADQGLYAGIPEISVSPAPVPPRAHPGR
ncbi:hypothetical protein LT18_03731 [Pseudomonas aeruginosa]|nr:hypothetical protein LT18_03731 [Pseudomonas aeruginosa]